MANHNFNTTLAKRYGIEEAIIIEHLYWWIHKNECNDEMFKDGRVWCYSSMKAFERYIAYMNGQKIRRVINKLQEKGKVLIGNYNKVATNQTLWYAFSDDMVDELQELDYDFSKMKNGVFKSEKSIEYNNNKDNLNNNLSELNNSSKSLLNCEVSFDDFYKLYPNKRSKPAAIKAWNRLSAKDKQKAYDTLPTYISDCALNKRSFQYPATYLNQRTFEDEFGKQKISFYDELLGDSDEKKRFKAYMRKQYPEIENTALPLSYEDYMQLVNEHGVETVTAAIEAMYGVIFKYRKSDIAKVIMTYLTTDD